MAVDLASLTLHMDSRGVVRAKDHLNRFVATGRIAEKQTDRLRNSATRLDDRYKKLGTTATRLGKQLRIDSYDSPAKGFLQQERSKLGRDTWQLPHRGDPSFPRARIAIGIPRHRAASIHVIAERDHPNRGDQVRSLAPLDEYPFL